MRECVSRFGVGVCTCVRRKTHNTCVWQPTRARHSPPIIETLKGAGTQQDRHHGLPKHTHLVHGARKPADGELQGALRCALVAPLLAHVCCWLALVPVAVEGQAQLAALLALERAPVK